MRPSLLILPLFFAGCSLLGGNNDLPRACTEEFRMYGVQVVDAQGRPVPGLAATSRVERTGAVLAEGHEPFPSEEGRYLVATDADRALIRPEGDTVLFTAVGPTLRAEASFTFFDDGCHVVQRSGPERVVAESVGG